MIPEIQKAIAAAASALYPGCTVYKDYDPQNFKMPSFLITIADQDYAKRLGTVNKGKVSVDLQYFSGVSATNIAGVRADCLVAQENLLHGFDLIGGFRVINKDARITDNVLHFTFDIKYSEILVSDETKMNIMQTNTSIKE